MKVAHPNLHLTKNANNIKRIFIVLLMVISLFLGANQSTALAEDREFSYTEKLGRGFSNTALGWMEIPIGIETIGNQYGNGAAATLGLLHGTGKAIQRTAYGIFEILTFPLDISPVFDDKKDALAKNSNGDEK